MESVMTSMQWKRLGKRIAAKIMNYYCTSEDQSYFEPFCGTCGVMIYILLKNRELPATSRKNLINT